MFDDDERVADVAQPGERGDEPLVVPLVKADRRFVEDVEDAREPRADLGGEPNALGLASGKRGGAARQAQVRQADIDEESQTRLDLLENLLGDLGLARVEFDGVGELFRLVDGEPADVVDVLSVDAHRKDLRPQPGASARLAVHLAHVAFVSVARPV